MEQHADGAGHRYPKSLQLTAPLQVALTVGATGGFVLGCREALLTLDANAFVQPGQYLFAYLAVPILAWVGLGVVLLLPCAIADVILRLKTASGLSPAWYAGLLGFGGALSISVPWIATVRSRLEEVGAPIRWGVDAALWSIALTLVGAAAGIAAVALSDARRQRILRSASRAVAVMAVLLLWPLGHFLATDWKWAARPSAAALPPVQSLEAPRPHVVLISIDTLRADHLGSFGGRSGLTPHLDRLAAEGVSFQHTITAAPWTLPAMASLFTGLYPHHHHAGQIMNRRDPLGRSPLPVGSWTLATALHEHGYRTHAVVTNPYLALSYGLGAGFDSYENVTIESETFLALADTTAARLLNWMRPDLVVEDRRETVSGRAVHWLARADKTHPFFLWLHYVDPHPPYSRAGASRNKSFRTNSLLAHSSSDGARLFLTSPDVARLRSGEIRLSDEQKDAVRDLYRAEVASVDAAIGTVLDALDRLGLRERTMVVVVADHGEEFWEHGGVEHGHTVYEELIRVPLLMRWPGHLPAGEKVDTLVRITDVAPTVLDLLGLPAAPRCDGETLLPALQGPQMVDRVALTENMLFSEERVGLRTRGYKYVRWENGKEEVYDLRADPKEQRDLAGSSAILNGLREEYASLNSQAPEVPSQSPERPTGDGTAEALRQLGYLH